jgi:sulfopyruvate decarboxylase TPP-binding subunit
MMDTGQYLTTALRELEVTHLVWLPDAATGAWETALSAAPDLQLARVCREGEAWGIAAGLWLGGGRPLLVLQNTGLFESGDALRNVLFDLRLPLYAVVGYRNYLVPDARDTARQFTEPILKAWGLEYVLLDELQPWRTLVEHYRSCQARQVPGIALLPEGRG